MAQSSKSTTCMIACWVIAILVGMIVVYVTAQSMPYVVPLFLGLIATLIVGLVLLKLLCKSQAPVAAAQGISTAQAAEPDVDEQDAAAAVEAVNAAMAAEETGADSAAPSQNDQDDQGDATQPAGLSAPRDTGADDLKQIKGVGPKLEQLLNSLGLFHFDQIAAWSVSDVAWMDDNLKGFKGRVSRDGWVDQAKILAAGEETEFSKRVEDGDVY